MTLATLQVLAFAETNVDCRQNRGEKKNTSTTQDNSKGSHERKKAFSETAQCVWDTKVDLGGTEMT